MGKMLLRKFFILGVEDKKSSGLSIKFQGRVSREEFIKEDKGLEREEERLVLQREFYNEESSFQC